MSEEGYMQTKIREMNDRVEEVSKRLDELAYKVNNGLDRLQKQEDDVKSSTESLKKLMAEIDSGALKSTFNEMALKNNEKVMKRINEVIEKLELEMETKHLQQLGIVIKTEVDAKGKAMFRDFWDIMTYLCQIVFDMMKEQRVNKDIPIFMMEGNGGEPDHIFIFDFSKEELTVEVEKGKLKEYQKRLNPRWKLPGAKKVI